MTPAALAAARRLVPKLDVRSPPPQPPHALGLALEVLADHGDPVPPIRSPAYSAYASAILAGQAEGHQSAGPAKEQHWRDWERAVRGGWRGTVVLLAWSEPLLSWSDPERVDEIVRGLPMGYEHLTAVGGGRILAAALDFRGWTDRAFAIADACASPDDREAVLQTIDAARVLRGHDDGPTASRPAFGQGGRPSSAALVALAAVDPERADELLHDDELIVGGLSTDAMSLVARWLAQSGRHADLISRCTTGPYLGLGCEWLTASARVGAVAVDEAVSIGLVLGDRVEEWLDPQSWQSALDPLLELSGLVGADELLARICHRFVPGPAQLIDDLTAGLRVRAVTDGPAAEAWVDRIGDPVDWAEIFEPGELLHAPWRGTEPVAVAVLAEEPTTSAKAVAIDALAVTAARPDTRVWGHPLDGLVPWRPAGGG